MLFAAAMPEGVTVMRRTSIIRMFVPAASAFALALAACCGALAQTLLPDPDLGLMVDGGTVSAIAVQPDGKIVIGGTFDRVNGVPRHNLARLNADRTLDTTWDPNPNNSAVNVIAIAGTTVYVGGNFSSIGGSLRNILAALDGTTGLATAWNPNPIADVRAIVPAGPVVYVGGLFVNIGGQPRNRIAAIDAATGLATAWNPNADSAVFALALSGTTLYAGGAFSNIGGASRFSGAALDTTVNTNNALAWNPSSNNSILHLQLGAGVVYASGNFSNIGTQTRNDFAALDATTGTATAFDATPNGSVAAMALVGSTLYVGGDFSQMGGAPRLNIAALDASTGLATTWAPDANENVQALAPAGSAIWAGGDFYEIGGVAAMQVALLDTATGLPVAGFHPSAGTIGYATAAFAQTDGKVLVGFGQFRWAGKAGLARNNLLRLNADGTLDTAFDPMPIDPPPSIMEFAQSGSTLYVGGSFPAIGGQPRNNLAALDVATGNATSWNPDCNGFVRTISLSGSTLYIGGDFTHVGGQDRQYAAAIDTVSGNATAWNPGPDNGVERLQATPTTIYAGGFFGNIGGQPRSRVAELDNNAGNATSWNPVAFNGSVTSFVLTPSIVYVGGSFDNIGGQPRKSIAALDRTTGLATPWDPNPLPMFGNEVTAINLSGTKLYVGGAFTTIGGQTRGHFASLDLATGNATSWNPTVAGSAVTSIAVTGQGVFGVGGVLTVLGQVRDGPFAVTPDIAVAPVLASVASRKVHGAAGPFDLPLSTVVPPVVNHNPTTEPRLGPAQTIVFTFDKPVNAANVNVSEGTAIAAAPTFSGNEVVVGLTGVTNQQYVTVDLTSVGSTDGGSGGAGSVRIGFLAGDVNQTRVVTVADLGIVNAQLAQPVTTANFTKDVNASGSVTVADKGITNANLTKALAAP